MEMSLTTPSTFLSSIQDEEFLSIITPIIENETVQQMKQFRQHYDTSCFEHCLQVVYYSYLLCKKWNLDYTSVARAGMLHDLFLYNWRHSKKNLNLDGWHAFVHPKIALANATKLFSLNKKEQDIIRKHMWPVTIAFPRYLESFIVTFVDKYCATHESLEFYQEKLQNKKLYRYAYIFLGLYIFCL